MKKNLFCLIMALIFFLALPVFFSAFSGTGLTYHNESEPASPSLKRLVIDPGHGGKDPGAVSSYIIEKEFNFDFSLALRDYLKKYYLVDILMTRETDEDIKLDDRAQMANAWNADFFFSVHSNAFNGVASGYEDFIFNGEVCDDNVRIRREIHPYIAGVWEGAGRPNRGMKKADFRVLRNTKMPAMLVEMGFLDNKEDAALLNNEDFFIRLVEQTGEGIAAALGLPPLLGMEGPGIDVNQNWTAAEKVQVKMNKNADTVDHIEYSLYGATEKGWQKYTKPFDIKNEGKTIIMARNVFAGIDLVSDSVTAVVKIDRTGPEEPVIKLSSNSWTRSDVSFTITDGIDVGDETDFTLIENGDHDFSAGFLNNLAANDGGGLKLDRWEEPFEGDNVLTMGSLPVSRSKEAARSGNYGLLTTTDDEHGQRVSYEHMCRGDDFYYSGWVRTDSSYRGTALTGLSFGVPWEVERKGYQAIIDVRSGEGHSAAFQLRRDYWTLIATDDNLKIEAEEWYRIEIFWSESGKITARLYEENGEMVSEISGEDNVYKSGLYGVCAFGNSSFDDLVAGTFSNYHSDIFVGYAESGAAGDFHHVLFQAKEDFQGDIRLSALNFSKGFKNAGEAELGSVQCLDGSGYQLLNSESFSEGDKYVVINNISLKKGSFYVIGNTNGYYRKEDKVRPQGGYMNILKSGHLRRDIGTDLYNRTYGFAEYVFIPQKTTGYRLSPPLDLSSLGIVAGSRISWDASIPAGSDVFVEVSYNGLTWHKVANGNPLPFLSNGDNLEGKTLYLRQTLTTESDYKGPRLNQLTVDIRGISHGAGGVTSQYRIGKDGTWKGYNESLIVNDAGITEIYARSRDRLGNIGPEAVAEVKIDRKAPDIKFEMVRSDGNLYKEGRRTPLDVSVTPHFTDSESGIDETSMALSLDGGLTWVLYSDPVIISGEGNYTVKARCKDNVGNKAEKSVTIQIGDPAPGDITGTGDITVTDAITLLRYLAGLVDLEEDQLVRSRVNNYLSGPCVSDVITILRFIVGILNDFPVNSQLMNEEDEPENY